jgi:hypothetical protein
LIPSSVRPIAVNFTVRFAAINNLTENSIINDGGMKS